MPEVRQTKDVKERSDRIRIDEIKIVRPERRNLAHKFIGRMKKGKDATCS